LITLIINTIYLLCLNHNNEVSVIL
jgi:hypothetical protein